LSLYPLQICGLIDFVVVA